MLPSDVVVAFEADFLGTWISPVEFAAAYTRQRPRLHVQVESRMTLTGSKADRRIVVAPGAYDFSRRAFAASPMASVDTWKSPVLLIHGDDDRNVSFIESINLIIALRKRGVDVEQLVFPDAVHDFLRHQNWLRGYKATADFFNRKLRHRSN